MRIGSWKVSVAGSRDLSVDCWVVDPPPLFSESSYGIYLQDL